MLAPFTTVILIPQGREKNLGLISTHLSGKNQRCLKAWPYASPRMSHPLGDANRLVHAASHFIAALRST